MEKTGAKRKNQILAKWDNFENRPSCKGYTLCKMVSLGQKFKWQKKCEKRFYKHVRVLLCKKPLQKTPNIGEIRPFLKSAILQRVYTLQNDQFGSKTSNREKRAKNDSTSTLELFCVKNRWKKHQIFEKWDQFQNRPPCKGYRLSKMVSLAEKLKWLKTYQKRFYKQVRVVLCKKTAGKNTKYLRNETILKNRPSCKGKGHLA